MVDLCLTVDVGKQGWSEEMTSGVNFASSIYQTRTTSNGIVHQPLHLGHSIRINQRSPLPLKAAPRVGNLDQRRIAISIKGNGNKQLEMYYSDPPGLLPTEILHRRLITCESARRKKHNAADICLARGDVMSSTQCCGTRVYTNKNQ